MKTTNTNNLIDQLKIIRKQLNDINCKYHSYGHSQQYNDFDGVVYALECLTSKLKYGITVQKVSTFEETVE